MSVASHPGRTGTRVLVLVMACNKHDAAPAPPSAVIEIDRNATDPALVIAFDHAVPQLPAISGDGASIASFATRLPPMPPPAVAAWYVAVTPVNRRASAEQLVLVDAALADDARRANANWSAQPPAAPLVATLRDRAAVVTRRLHDGGYGSLAHLDVTTNDAGEPQPLHVGELVVSAENHLNDSPARTVFELELTNGQGKVVQQTKTLGYSGAGRASAPDTRCGYRPFLAAAFGDAAKRHLYFQIDFHTTDDCAPPETRWIGWILP